MIPSNKLMREAERSRQSHASTAAGSVAGGSSLGQAIIIKTIHEFLDRTVSAVQLDSTIGVLEDSPEPWDQGDPQHTLPTNAHFIHYILALLAATLLISDDFNTDFASAHSIMLASSDYGDMFNFHSPPNVLVKMESKAGDSLSSMSHLR
ncbi:hypothetical protein B0H14DRAFT_3854446 [Mycena olivaceomarginata]|nr:hypothetical protein B0H14DRAFT_3854446 [Mycena olivaceomarginata]